MAAPDSRALIVLDARTGQRAEAPLRTTGAPARLALGAHGVWVADTAGGAIVPVDRDGRASFAPESRSGPSVAGAALSARAVWAISSAKGRGPGSSSPAARGRRSCPSAATPSTSPRAGRGSRHPRPPATGRWHGSTRRPAGWPAARASPTSPSRSLWQATPRGSPTARGAPSRVWTCERATSRAARSRWVCGRSRSPQTATTRCTASSCAGDGKVWSVEADGDVAWTRTAGTDPAGLALDARSVLGGRRRRWRRGDPS